MNNQTLYRVVLRSDTDSVWVQEEIFVGNLIEFINKFGSIKVNPLTPFKRNGKIYRYYITEFQDGFWHHSKDPRSN